MIIIYIITHSTGASRASLSSKLFGGILLKQPLRRINKTMLFFLFLCSLLASSTLVVQSSDSSYSSSSSRYCRRNIGHVADNCDCSAYQQLSCKAPSGCGYNGEGGGHQSKNTNSAGGYTNGEGATHSGSGGYSSSSSNGGSGKSYSTGESSGTSSSGSDSNNNGGGGSRYNGRALATSSLGKGDGEVAVFDVSISNISHRDLCGSNWDTRCECCCELINSGEVSVIYTSGFPVTVAASEALAGKPKPKHKPRPHPKLPHQAASGDESSTVHVSSRIGPAHFVIGGSMFCALGAYILDRKSRQSIWGRQKAAEDTENYDSNPDLPQTHYVIAVV